jgi:hypothetical protein
MKMVFRLLVFVLLVGARLVGAQVPAAGMIAGGAFARPAIAQGPDGSVFVAAEGDRMGSVHLFKSGAGAAWSGGVVLASKRGGFVDAGRVYVPDLVVDPDGWAFVSARAGPKEWGTMHGPVVAVRSPSGVVSTRFLGSKAYPGAARLARDPARAGPVLLSKDGNWWELTRAAGTAASGWFNSGGTGEKYAFQVSGSTWWTAINGCRVDPSSVSIGGRRIVWADYGVYGRWYGSDLCYVSLCVVGQVGYVAATMGGRVRLQVVKNGVCRYPITNLGDLGPGTLEDRCPPRLLKVPGGPVAVWAFGGAVLAVRVKDCLAGRAKPVQVAVGAFPAVCLLADGRIGLVTVRRDGLYYAAIAAP